MSFKSRATPKPIMSLNGEDLNAHLNVQIKANEYRIEAFKEKMEEAGPTFKARYRNEAAVLELRNLSLKKKLGDYKNEGSVKLEEFRTNFNDDIDGVGRSMTALFKDDG